MRYLFACGGTGGHINPAIAVAHAVRRHEPASEILFVGSQGGMEEKLIPREGFAIRSILIRTFHYRLSVDAVKKNIEAFWAMRKAVKVAEEILQDFKPDVVLGTGGYICAPTMQAAQQLGLPNVLHESNAQPGRANRTLSNKATSVMVTFPGFERYYKHPERVLLTGTPVREDFIFGRRRKAREELGLPDKPTVVSFFGSLGAREMNRQICDFAALNRDWHHIHACGEKAYPSMKQTLSERGLLGSVDLRPYIYDMPQVLAASDVVICRAGASTIAELAVAGKPSILIPSPNVTNNHQEPNARAIEQAGGGLMFLESECSGEKLYQSVRGLLEEPRRLAEMEAALFRLAIPDAAEKIFENLRRIAREK